MTTKRQRQAADALAAALADPGTNDWLVGAIESHAKARSRDGLASPPRHAREHVADVARVTLTMWTSHANAEAREFCTKLRLGRWHRLCEIARHARVPARNVGARGKRCRRWKVRR